MTRTQSGGDILFARNAGFPADNLNLIGGCDSKLYTIGSGVENFYFDIFADEETFAAAAPYN